MSEKIEGINLVVLMMRFASYASRLKASKINSKSEFNDTYTKSLFSFGSIMLRTLFFYSIIVTLFSCYSIYSKFLILANSISIVQ
jgi:hypothetical protein